MFTFKSPVIPEHIWKICFKTKDELVKIFYEDKIPKDIETITGLIDFTASTIYIDKELDDILLAKELRNKIMHLYLWETGQQDREYSEEEFCELTSVSAPLICKTTNDIILELKNSNNT